MNVPSLRSSPLVQAWHRAMVVICVAVLLMAYSPNRALARDDPDAIHYDARVQGYQPDVELKNGGLAMTWTVLFLMGIICVSVIFKDAKRSHLD